MRQAIETGAQQEMVDWLRPQYAARLDAMDRALRREIGDRARWRRPHGGYFFWLELEQDIDTVELKEKAMKGGVGFQPGPVFSCQGGFGNYLRLSFAHYSIEEINEGVIRLGRFILEKP
jgi:DNA-binding transcriptional MocR family regulator